MTTRLLTVTEVAERLGVNRAFVYKLIDDKRLDVIRLGTHRYRITEAGLERWVLEQSSPAVDPAA